MKRSRAQWLATSWLLAGACCGTALVASLSGAGVGGLDVALAVGLAILAVVYALG